MIPIVIVMQIANQMPPQRSTTTAEKPRRSPTAPPVPSTDREVRSCLSERGSDFGWGRSSDGERENGVEEEAGSSDRDDSQDDGDEHGTAQILKRFAAKRVGFEIVHCDPDPHRGQELHERQPPVEDEQPHAVEEHSKTNLNE